MKSRKDFDKKYDELSGKIFGEVATQDKDEDAIAQAEIEAVLFLSGEVDEVAAALLGAGDETEDESGEVMEISRFMGILDPRIPFPMMDTDLSEVIAYLKEDRRALPERSDMGEPLWKMLDAQIAICEWAKGE